MNLNELIEGTRHFRWKEAIKSGDLLSESSDIFKSIVVTANELEQYRAYLGNRPIFISSWYRSPSRNKRVRGAKRSRHLFGDAIDFYCHHLSTYQIYEMLDRYHGSKGGLGLYKTHVHLDFRGYKARWKKV